VYKTRQLRWPGRAGVRRSSGQSVPALRERARRRWSAGLNFRCQVDAENSSRKVLGARPSIPVLNLPLLNLGGLTRGYAHKKSRQGSSASGATPKEMEADDTIRLQSDWVTAAKRARDIGLLPGRYS
jgi:hypothetical protein